MGGARRSLDVAATILTALLLLAFAAVSLRGWIAPVFHPLALALIALTAALAWRRVAAGKANAG
jgi:hypothetical protein